MDKHTYIQGMQAYTYIFVSTYANIHIQTYASGKEGLISNLSIQKQPEELTDIHM